MLRRSQDRILKWWDNAYAEAQSQVSERFWIEAHSSLPGGEDKGQDLPDIFWALSHQRWRLKFDQQIPEWEA